jgi:drug/metabolite transporter (DMT)-like permease
MDKRTGRAIPVLVALGSTWGSSFLFIKVVLDHTGPAEVAFGRAFLGFLAITSFFLVTRRDFAPSRSLVLRVAAMALMGNVVPFLLIASAETRIASGTASVLNATVPIFTTMIAVALLEEETLTPTRVFGLVLALFGVVVLTGADIADLGSDVLGDLGVVLAAAMYGCGAVYARRALHGEDPSTVTLLTMAWAAAFLFPVLMVARAGQPDFSLSLKAWGAILCLGLVGTGAAYIAYYWLIATLGSVRAVLVTYIVPVVGVFLGWVVLGESVGLNTIAGGLLIVAGVASVMRAQAPRQPTPEPAVLAPAAATD